MQLLIGSNKQTTRFISTDSKSQSGYQAQYTPPMPTRRNCRVASRRRRRCVLGITHTFHSLATVPIGELTGHSMVQLDHEMFPLASENILWSGRLRARLSSVYSQASHLHDDHPSRRLGTTILLMPDGLTVDHK